MSALRLIDKPECPFCWRVRIAAALQSREVESLDRSEPEVLAEWQRLSPHRSVPVLIDGDLVLTDSGPILEYLAETGMALLPDSPRQRAEARSWMAYGDNVLGRSMREVVFEKRDKPEDEWDQERIREGVRGFLQGLPTIEKALDNGPFLAGGQPTLAECALFPRFALALTYGVEVPSDFPRIRQWIKRMVVHPAFMSASPERVRNILVEYA
ncbi:glutathione S-transferase family protein [Marinobacter sp.]|uniref:glutathione S-transferase family protein n=1 Tax=Marinobacter sp. TaxID=50741 RepID=UPI0034A17E45